MRSVNSRILALAAAAALAACGNYSTEDLRFLAAVPTRAELRVEVPAGATAAASACATRSADTWLWAKPTSDRLNATVDILLAHVDVVRRYPPSWRDADARGWGPFADGRHPGRELRVVMIRSFPAGLDGAPEFSYRFEARPTGAGAWSVVLSGTFRGASARSGAGALALDFEALWALEMADADAPRGLLSVQYDRTSAPATVALVLDQDGYGLERFGYRFADYGDGSGAFDYAFRNAGGVLVTVGAGFDPAGAGRARVTATTAAGQTGSFLQCWNAAACLVYVDDPGGYSCAVAPCSLGGPSACPAVPALPF
jgi:hypothetical protein